VTDGFHALASKDVGLADMKAFYERKEAMYSSYDWTDGVFTSWGSSSLLISTIVRGSYFYGTNFAIKMGRAGLVLRFFIFLLLNVDMPDETD
jgi:hypothetical protein